MFLSSDGNNVTYLSNEGNYAYQKDNKEKSIEEIIQEKLKSKTFATLGADSSRLATPSIVKEWDIITN